MAIIEKDSQQRVRITQSCADKASDLIEVRTTELSVPPDTFPNALYLQTFHHNDQPVAFEASWWNSKNPLESLNIIRKSCERLESSPKTLDHPAVTYRVRRTNNIPGQLYGSIAIFDSFEMFMRPPNILQDKLEKLKLTAVAVDTTPLSYACDFSDNGQRLATRWHVIGKVDLAVEVLQLLCESGIGAYTPKEKIHQLRCGVAEVLNIFPSQLTLNGHENGDTPHGL